MIRLVIRALIYFGSAALGIAVAAIVLDDVSVKPAGFITAVLIYAIVQTVLTPFITKVALRNAGALLGGTALVAALVALIAASVFGDSLTISGGIGTWIAATVVVWLASALAALLLPLILVKLGVESARAARKDES